MRIDRVRVAISVLATLLAASSRGVLAQPAANGANRGTPDSLRADSATRVAVGGFIDSYFAYDFSKPRSRDRAYTTQSARHAEFNINLAFIDLTLTAPRVRGRLALQTGTSVQVNYAAEPRIGAISGPDASRFVQEATAGYQLSRTLWIDAGVFFSPFGSESWISRDNATYTRSLVAENSPYYEAGVKATWQASRSLEAQVHVMNGWQNVSETNSDKALALRVDYRVAPQASMAYVAFVGNEQADSQPARTRAFQEFIVRLEPAQGVQLIGTFDYGRQRRRDANGFAIWRGYSVVARYQMQERLAASARVERYSDPEAVIVASQEGTGLRAYGASLGVDVVPSAPLLWRTEIRSLCVRSSATRCPLSAGALSGRNASIVTSLALTF